VSDDLSIPSPTYRVPRHRRGMDPLTKRLVVISCGLGAAMLVVVGSWSMLNRHSGTIPVVEAVNGPMKVKPANPGGMQIAGANDDVLSGDGKGADGKLAPPPETPAPQALRAPPAPVAAPPAPAPAALPAIAAAPVKPVDTKPTATPDKHVAAAAAPSGKDTLVQLAAVRSETDAKSTWERLTKRMPDLLGQHRPAFSKVDHDGRTLWRVRTGGFADITQAKDFCGRVRAKGESCTVAEF
jgi:cell division septation protein DedD